MLGQRKENPMFCPDCGREMSESSAFCPNCGAALGASPTASVPPPPPTAGPTPSAGDVSREIPGVTPPAPQAPQTYGISPSPEGQLASSPHAGPPGTAPYPHPEKRSALPWVLGGLGLLAAAVLSLVLAFLVLGGKGTATAGPEEAVRDFFRALELEDAGMLLEAMEPSFREELERALGDHRDAFFELFFSAVPDDLQVDIRKMTTELQGDEATVTVTDGTMTYTGDNGEKVSEEASAAEESSFEVVRVGGKWYMSGDFLVEAGLDPKELDYLDMLEEMDNGENVSDSLDRSGGLTGEEELAAVEEAMLEYVQENAETGLEFAVTGLLINGDEAVGIAVCLNQELENVPVVMARDAYGWYGVDFGSGIELPDWFLAETADVEEVMLDFAYLNSTGEVALEITNLAIRGNQAAAAVMSTGRDVETAAILAEKGPRGWYVVDFGTGIELPEWYWPQAYW